MQTAMDYSKASEWIIGEKSFSSRQLGKCEAIMALGNGYLGIRSATEEHYLKEKRHGYPCQFNASIKIRFYLVNSQ